MDPILTEINGPRLTMFPLENVAAFHAYKEAQALYWTAEEIDLSKDRDDFNTLSDDEKHFLENILGFFASSDALVNSNLLENFGTEVVQPEVKAFYSFQAAIETVHAETYSLLIDSLIEDNQRKLELFDAVKQLPAVAAKAAFVQKFMDPKTNSFAERLIAFASVEGILFSSSFASIFFFKRLNKMPGLCFSNELISRDEGLHTNFAVLLHSQLQQKAPQDRIIEIIKEAVEVESVFVREALKKPLIGMNSNDMVNYVKFVADRLLVDLGVKKVFNASNPFSFMTNQSMSGKTNFFEKRVSEYSKCGVGNTAEENSFNLEMVF